MQNHQQTHYKTHKKKTITTLNNNQTKNRNNKKHNKHTTNLESYQNHRNNITKIIVFFYMKHLQQAYNPLVFIQNLCKKSNTNLKVFNGKAFRPYQKAMKTKLSNHQKHRKTIKQTVENPYTNLTKTITKTFAKQLTTPLTRQTSRWARRGCADRPLCLSGTRALSREFFFLCCQDLLWCFEGFAIVFFLLFACCFSC